MLSRKKIAGLIAAVVFVVSADVALLDVRSENTVVDVSGAVQSMLPSEDTAASGRHSFSKLVNVQPVNDFDMASKLPENREVQRIDRMLQRIGHGKIKQYIFGELKTEIQRRAP